MQKLYSKGIEIRGTIAGIGLCVEFDTKPRARLADSLADFRGVLSDTGRKYEAVQCRPTPLQAHRFP